MATVLGTLILGEHLTGVTALGALLLLLGLVVLTVAPRHDTP
jgi:drug/metabolite transporter (DMT)-like permease